MARSTTMLVTSILFIIFGIAGVFMALMAFPYLAEYNITYAASLPSQVYYGVLLLGSLIYLSTGICGVAFINNPGKRLLLRVMCFTAFAYIIIGSILWFGVYAGVYEEHIAIAVIEIVLGVAVSSVFMFSTFGKPITG